MFQELASEARDHAKLGAAGDVHMIRGEQVSAKQLSGYLASLPAKTCPHSSQRYHWSASTVFRRMVTTGSVDELAHWVHGNDGEL